MHSSRMRTARLLPVSPSMHCSRGVYLVRGMYLVPGGQEVCPCPGVPAQVLPHPPRTEFLTHASENITLPQTSFAGGNNTNPYNII